MKCPEEADLQRQKASHCLPRPGGARMRGMNEGSLGGDRNVLKQACGDGCTTL